MPHPRVRLAPTDADIPQGVLRALGDRFAAVRSELALSLDYPADALAEAALVAASPPDLPDRDETALPFFTVDPAGSMDLDQAMCLERDGEVSGARLRWANAGHPPAVCISADGEVSLLDEKPADLLLGVFPETMREDHVSALEPGATLLLYTDGLVERRDRDIDAGTEALMDVVREIADLPLPELCDRLLERLFLPDAQDDVAVLAIRLSPEA